MKYAKKMFVMLLLTANQSICADLPEPYLSIHNLPQTPYYVQDSYVYYNLITTHNAAVIVDVDSQDGGVARFIAQQAANMPTVTKIYSVNIWADHYASKHQFQRFLSNVKQENSTGLIIPVRMNSLDAASALNINADFISLVGGNDTDTIYKEILAWYPHLSDRGVMCGNNWYESSVQIGVTKAAKSLDLTLNISSNVWYFVKNSS